MRAPQSSLSQAEPRPVKLWLSADPSLTMPESAEDGLVGCMSKVAIEEVERENVVMVDTVEGVKGMLEKIKSDGTKELAIDFEGVDLCRSGELCVMQLSDGDRTWIVDIYTLGKDAFGEGGLRAFMQDSSRVTLVGYDGRADADALFHQYSTVLGSFYDIQIASCTRQDKEQGRRDRFVHGLGRAMAAFLENDPRKASEIEKTKKAGLALFAPEKGGSYEVWKERPMSRALVDYAAADVALLLDMKRAWLQFSPARENIPKAACRINKAVQGRLPAKGKHMAMKDF